MADPVAGSPAPGRPGGGSGPAPAPPLDGVRVLDLSGPIGAYCGRLLADLGADVILVEPPGGDPLRGKPPFKADHPDAGLLFAYYRASQRRLVREQDSHDRLAHLGREADVVIISPSARRPVPGWDAGAGTLDWAPGAVVCAITPFGLTGPWRSWRSTPMVSYAMGGGMDKVGPPEGPPVTVPGRQQWDEAATHAALCILAALRVRAAVGPQVIDLSVHETAALKDFLVERYDVLGMSTLGRLVGIGIPPTATYECVDGPFDVAAHQVRHWDAFLEMLGHPEELSDPALADPLVRRDRYEEVLKQIGQLLSTRSRQEMVELGQGAGLPCSILHRPTELIDDPQVQDRDVLPVTPTPFGPVRMPGPGFRTTPTLAAPRSAAPAVGDPDASGWRPARARAVTSSAGSGALSGVRVLSFGVFVAGNTTACLLAELGADVAKIEDRGHPEVLRSPAYAIGPTVTEPSGATNTVMNASLGRSVRNLSLDMGSTAGRDLFRRLVAVADVVVENFSAGVLDRWGLGFDALKAINPRIVLTSLSGYGRSGPRSSYLAYATNISNFVGLTYAWGYCHGTQSDYLTAQHAAVGTLAALRSAQLTGEGVHVDVAQTEVMAALMPELLLDAAANGRDAPRPGNQVPGALLSGVYRCVGHDAWLAVEIEDLGDWSALCRFLEVPGLDASSEEEAGDLRAGLDAALAGWAADNTPHTAAHLLQAAGLAAGAVQNSEDIWRDPQLRSRGFMVPLDQPDLGPYHYGQSPHRMSVTPGRARHAGVRLGQHTGAVLAEWLGLDDAEVTSLLEAGSAFQG